MSIKNNIIRIKNLGSAKDFVSFVELFVIFIPSFFMKIFIRNLWLICESPSEARDNGFALFKYLRENHPEQKVVYAIKRDSKDRDKIVKLGKCINYGGIIHWFYYLIADKNISSQKGGKPCASICYLFEVVFKLRKHNRVFLQHGITINESSWLYYKKCYFDKFICGAKPEYDFILNKFGYDYKTLKYTGFARFDFLHDTEIDKDLIVVIPSWREQIYFNSKKNDFDFTKTDYFKYWSEFITSSKLKVMLEKYHKKLLFYPHRDMSVFFDKFPKLNGIIDTVSWPNFEVSTLLRKGQYLITDYSSVFFDFAYMKKPSIFFQFDEEYFRATQYKQGFFDYKNNDLGKWCDNVDSLLSHLENLLTKEDPLLDNSVINKYFPLYDTLNCERIYKCIKEEE